MVDEFYVSFKPKFIKINKELFGKTLPFTFRRTKYNIVLFNVTSLSKGGPKLQVTGVGTDIRQLAERDFMKFLGVDHFIISLDGDTMIIGGFVVHARSEVRKADASRIISDLLVWQDLVVSWVEALNLTPLDGLHDTESWLYSPHVDYFLKQTRDNTNIGAGVEISKKGKVVPPPPLTVSEAVLKEALLMAEKNTTPPMRLTMMVSSRKHLNANKNRQSLFDTATAIEIAMSDILKTRLLSVEHSYRKSLFKESKQISGLVRALRLTGFIVDDSIQKYIGTPRNKAIHKGETISREQAERAFDTAVSFVEISGLNYKK